MWLQALGGEAQAPQVCSSLIDASIPRLQGCNSSWLVPDVQSERASSQIERLASYCWVKVNLSQSHNSPTTMRSLFSVLLLCLVSTVAAVSSSGSKLLVVLEDAAEKSKYSKFWKQLEGKADSHTSICMCDFPFMMLIQPRHR